MPVAGSEEWSRLSPAALAAAYDRYVAARWRGEPVEEFASWLEAHWTAQPSPEPDDDPDAVSGLGVAAHRVHWHVGGTAILGYVAGRPGGHYWIPVDATPPPTSVRRVDLVGWRPPPAEPSR